MSNDQIYRELQRHLDKETVSFPETASGSDLQLLRAMFAEREAAVAMLLTHRYEGLDRIGERTSEAIAEVEQVLDDSARRGMIGARLQDGVKQYRNIPLLIGMAEAGSHSPTREFSAAIAAYFADSDFIGDFLSSPVPQMRVIPVEESVTPDLEIGSYDEVEHMIESTTQPIGILPCVCRVGSDRRGDACEVTTREETCMVFNENAVNLIASGGGREVSKAEALDILRQNAEDGLILQPSNTKGPDFICSCCGCCCGILQMHKSIADPVAIWASNFYAVVDNGSCTDCEACVERCQVDAMSRDDASGDYQVDLKRCLGCGNCYAACPAEAVELHRKEKETVPPADTEELFELIA